MRTATPKDRFAGRALRPALAAVAALLLAAEPANACAVCFSGTEETRLAFLLTTIFLTLLPLVLVGSLAWWLRRRAVELRREVEPRPATPGRPGA